MSAATADLLVFIPTSFFVVLGTPFQASFFPCKFWLIIHFSCQSHVFFLTVYFMIFFFSLLFSTSCYLSFLLCTTVLLPIPLLKLNTVLAFKALNAVCLTKGTGLTCPTATTSLQFSPPALNREWLDQLVPSRTWQERTVACLFWLWL